MAGRPGAPVIRRLGAYDRHCLRVETAARPVHVGILAVLDGGALCDADGRLRLADLRTSIAARVARVPELRRVVHCPRRPAGGPVWVDDPRFDIAHHLDAVAVPPPGDEAALLALVETLLAPTLDRSRPLWRLWFLTGLDGDRAAVLAIVHHALADGMTAMRLVRTILEPPLGQVPEAGPAVLPTTDRPSRRALVRDNVRSILEAARRLTRPEAWRQARVVAGYLRAAAAVSRGTPVSSLNAPVGPRRALRPVRLDVRTLKRVARAHGCGANDVVLALASGGIRALLEARGEPVDGRRPRAGVAVAMFSPGRADGAGNDIGTLHVPLPTDVPGPAARLPLLAAAREQATRSPMVAAEPVVRAWFGRLGPLRRSLERQRLVNLSETYLPGPPAPIGILGARVVDLLPLAPLAGNLALSFVALSYAGRLTIAVRADADRFPDLEVLASAMERDWEALAQSIGTSSPGAAAHGRRAPGPPGPAPAPVGA